MSSSSQAYRKIAELFMLAAIATNDEAKRASLLQISENANEMSTRKTAASRLKRVLIRPSVKSVGYKAVQTAPVLPGTPQVFMGGAKPPQNTAVIPTGVAAARQQNTGVIPANVPVARTTSAGGGPALTGIPGPGPTPVGAGPTPVSAGPAAQASAGSVKYKANPKRRASGGGSSQAGAAAAGVGAGAATAPPVEPDTPIKQSLLRRLAGSVGRGVGRTAAHPVGGLFTGMLGLGAFNAAGQAVSDMRANSFTDATSNPGNTNAGMFPGLSRWWNSADYGDNQWMQYRKDALQNPNFQQLQDSDVVNFAKMTPAEQEQVYRAMILSQRNRENAAFAKANGKEYSWVNDANNPFNVEGLSDSNLAMRLETLAKANQLLPKVDKTWLPASLSSQAVPPGGNSMLGGNPPASTPAPAGSSPKDPDSLARALQQQLEADAAAERERALALAQIRQQQRILELLKGSRNNVTGVDPARFLSGR